jgi:hypothetical protein
VRRIPVSILREKLAVDVHPNATRLFRDGHISEEERA